MRPIAFLCSACLTLSFLLSANPTEVRAADKETPRVLDFEMESLSGKPVQLKDYAGKVVLIVNTASECGATPQYKPLQKLHEKYADKGLVVLGFPCNQFGAQEPGSAKEIQEFCTQQYGVTFPMFAKIDVNGADAAPLYQYLTSKETNPEFAGKIKWNFEKFLISRDGRIVGRYGTRVDPASAELVRAVEAELAK